MVKNKILDTGLCLGCGLCVEDANIFKSMIIDQKTGFFYPNGKVDKNVEKYCPSIILSANYKPRNREEVIWGPIKNYFKGFASSKEVRFRGSSGGALTALLIYLIEKKIIDGVLQISQYKQNPKLNFLSNISSSCELIINAGSKYAPTLSLFGLKRMFKLHKHKFAFVGKPCDISGLSNYLKIYPEYKDRIYIKISFFCAGMPSINATDKILDKLGVDRDLLTLRYRGYGWPGYFYAKDRNNKEGQISYKDSWGEILGKNLHPRCKFCPDGIGIESDVTFADAWEENDGYPTFVDKPGESLIISRTNLGNEIIEDAFNNGYLKIQKTIANLKVIQKYQYYRRINIAARMLAVNIFHPFKFSFKGFYSYKLILESDIFSLVGNFVGTFRRFFKSRCIGISIIIKNVLNLNGS